MNSLLHSFLADISSIPWVALVAVGGSMLLTIVVIVGGLMIAHRRQQLWHETARLALEKGQPLPSLPDAPAPLPRSPRETGRSDVRRGLVLIGVGIGVHLFLHNLVGPAMGYVGAIPGFIGAALLLSGIISLILNRKNPPTSDHS